jgi:SAM-dependent methyltransferase
VSSKIPDQASGKWSRASKEYYDSLGREFVEMEEYWQNPYDVATWKMENDLVAEHLGDRHLLLDLGVGFYPHVESTAGKNLVCVDVSCQSLRIARRVYHQCNENMEYVCADAMALPFRNAAFEGIIAGGELVNHMPAKPMLDEASRVLKKGGKIILSVGMKWCIDSLYALLDSLIGNKIGYAMTRNEAAEFIRSTGSTDVTWEVTPSLNLRVKLYTRGDIKKVISSVNMRIVQIRSLDLISGIVPLPVQQDRHGRLINGITEGLLLLDRQLGKLPGMRWFAGNLYVVIA